MIIIIKWYNLRASGFRNLKVLLSVGGWTYSQDGHFSFVTNPSLRATFVASAVQFLKDYGFDGMYSAFSCHDRSCCRLTLPPS